MSGQMMEFPDTFEEFAKEYGFRDREEIYTNGSELITVFRVKQWLDHENWKKKKALEDIEININSMKENAKKHEKEVRQNGEMVAAGLEMARDILKKHLGEEI